MGTVNCLIEETHIWNNLMVSMTQFKFLELKYPFKGIEMLK